MFEIPLSALFFMNSVTNWISIHIEESFKPYLSNSSSSALEMPSKHQLGHPKRRPVIKNEVKGEDGGCVEVISFFSAAFSLENLQDL
jgi:hypothetical protein